MFSTKTRPDPVRTVSEHEIAECAYGLWLARGCPVGDGREDWFAARALLLSKLQPEADRRAAPVPKNALRMLAAPRVMNLEPD